MDNKLRSWLRNNVSKQTRHSIIEKYIKYEYWYRQGQTVLTSFKLTSIMELMGVLAFVKYMLGEQPMWVYGCICVGFGVVWVPLRTGALILMGKFWHDNKGYDAQTTWNKDKVPPTRTIIINHEDIGKSIASRYNWRNR